MKKIFMIFMSAVFSIGIATAQYGPTKFTDNVTVGIKGGITTPMTDIYHGVSPVVGVNLEKSVTPWLGFAVDANTLIANPYGSANPHTMFDMINVNLLGKFNLNNMFNYDGTRKFFEHSLYAGVGFGHRNCHDYELRHYMVTKVGMDFDFNLGKEKAWGVRVSPACVWGPVEHGKLNAKNGGFELTAGVVYHFKNKDGNRAYTKVTPRSQEEIDHLNSLIADLHNSLNEKNNENQKLKECMTDMHTQMHEMKSHVCETRVDTVYVNLNTNNYFKAGSDEVISKAAIRNLAKTLDPNKKYVVVGYASEEGNAEYNMDLSERRAEMVYTLLIKYGFPQDNLLYRGEGATTQFSESSRDENRVTVVKEQ